MDLKSVKYNVHILCVAVLQLLQDFDLVDGYFDGVILRSSIDLVICQIDVDDFESDNTIVFFIVASRKDPD